MALILEFGAYWVAQTIELWNVSTRDELTDGECPEQGHRLMGAL